MNRETTGKEIVTEMFGKPLDEQRPAFKDMATITSDYLFGEIWSREGLARRDRSLVTVAILVATGKEVQLKTHLRGALSNGLTPEELKEMMIHAAHYSGWPSGMNGLRVLQELSDEDGFSFDSEDSGSS